MKAKGNFGYKFLLVIALAIALLNVAAKGYKVSFVKYTPGPDTTAVDDSTDEDTLHKLHFPLHDRTGDPAVDYNNPSSIDLKDPKNIKKTVEYDADSNQYTFHERLGEDYYRNPTYMSLDDYLKYRGRMDEDAYWQRRLDALMLFNKQPDLPQMYREGLFDRIFGNSTISVKPQGNVDVTFGGKWQDIKNPTLVQRAQKYGIFDFDMQMNINLLATIGDKMKLNISNNTHATFDYQNMQKLDYSGKEDEMIKKIEAGNVSFPLKSNLISGVQSLFGLKMTLQFGKLWVTGVMSQQKSQRKSLTIQGGAQAQQFSIKADSYEENKDFLLGQYFHDHYNTALTNFPLLNSLVNITRIEVWVTNRTGAVNGVRSILAFQDLGEANPYRPSMNNGGGGVRYGLPDNHNNRLYTDLLLNPNGRLQSSSTSSAQALGLTQGVDFEPTTARKLSNTEYYFNPTLGYIMLNTQLNPDDVLGVAYQYTYNGHVFQVGEFAEDIPPDSTNPKVMFVKLLKATAPSPGLPVWNLMMKNVYQLGGAGVTKDNFILNVDYQAPGGGDIRYIPEGPKAGTTFLSLLNLDRLNAQGEAQPDGLFDYVEGITINSKQGKIIFPVLEPFGKDLLPALGDPPDQSLIRKYIYQVLYDSTKIVAQQSQSTDRYLLKGSYKSSGGAEIFLGGFNIPPGSVTVTAGGTKLVENQDYQVEYGVGKLKILNQGILASGVPINIQYEDNSTFGFQQQNFMGLRLDYYANRDLTLGMTLMRLNERPFTQKVVFGEDPTKNTVAGADANFQKEVPAITRALDKLPIYSTVAPSFVKATGEVAGLMPNHPKQINALDPEGSVYIDDFEGATSNYDLRFPSIAWSMASTPVGAVDKTGMTLFPESTADDQLIYGTNRAKLAWYSIEPTLVDPGTGVPSYVSNDSNQHYIRMVQEQDVFPNVPVVSLQTALTTLDLGFYPNQRGPYNFDATNIDNNGMLLNPKGRWGGIQRPIDNTDFEASNVEYIEFWVMDPFIHNTSSTGGSLYLNLGDVSEDVVKDSRLFFENGIPSPFEGNQLDTTAWGYVPKFEEQITRAFDNDPNARAIQDVGYDGLPDSAIVPGQLSEQVKFAPFLNQLGRKLGTGNPAYQNVYIDPASDNYHYYRGSDYDAANLGILGRYKNYTNPQGNSPITSPSSSYATSETTIPESEDINRDNTLNEEENYFQYRIDLRPNMQVGTNNIVNVQVAPNVKLPNGTYENETWYQFKIPIHNYDHKIGGISDFRSIRFMRMFLSGFQDSVYLRFAQLSLDRSQWRTYNYSLMTPGETLPQPNSGLTNFSVSSINIEENGSRYPVPYVIPPGVARQLTSVSSGQSIQLNEQSLAIQACALQDGDARGVYKEVDVDMRQFSYLRMFIHCEGILGSPPIKNADVYGFIRIGSDYTNNYYEYDMPLTITPFGVSTNAIDQIWPSTNEMDITLQDLVNAKKERDAKGIPSYQPYTTKDSKGNTIIVVGDPNIGGAKDVMLGVLNPKKTATSQGDDGLPKCTMIWFDELRMAGINDHPGYAAAGKVAVQLADLGNVNLSGSMHTPGYGNIDQKIQQRSQDNYAQYNVSTNLNLGKLMPRNWGVQLPLFVGYTQNVSTPKYDPFDQDVLLSDELHAAKSAALRDSIKRAAQDFTSITSINLTNVRINGDPSTASAIRMPWSIKNFDFSYSYNDQYKHNPTLSEDNTNTQKFGLGYTYAIKSKPIEPFKHLIKGKSKWYSLIKDFNFNPVPSSFTFRNDMLRVSEEMVVRNTFGDALPMPPSFSKNFTWNRVYKTRWELTKSISIDYTATNISRVDEPYGKINTKAKYDSLFGQLEKFGHNTNYNQTFSSAYTLPLSKLPLTDWINIKMSYGATYSWLGAAPVAEVLGNTIGNTVNKQITGDLNMNDLYKKWRWLRALSTSSTSNVQGKTIQSLEKPNSAGSSNVKDIRKLNNGQGGFSSDVNDSGPPGGGGGGNAGGNSGNGGTTNGGGNAGGGAGAGGTGNSGSNSGAGGGAGSSGNGGNSGGGTGSGAPTGGSSGSSGNDNSGGGSNSGADNTSGSGGSGGSTSGGNNTGSNSNSGGNTGGGSGSGSGNTGGNTGAGGNTGSGASGGGNNTATGGSGGNTISGNAGSGNGSGTTGNAGFGNGNNGGGGPGGKGNGGKGGNGSNGSNKNGSGNNNNGGGSSSGNGISNNTGNPPGTGGNIGNSVMLPSNMTDEQLDSMIDVQNQQDAARAAAELKKRKAAKKAAKKARRAKLPTLTPAEQVLGHILTMVNRITVNYTETGGIVLPGYLDSTHFMGINNFNLNPGLKFVYGYQPNNAWLNTMANKNLFTRDSLFNTNLQQTFSTNLNATATIQPMKSLKIDLNLRKTFSMSNSELYKDTGTGVFNRLNPLQTGSYDITYVSLYSMFKGTGANSTVYNQFIANTLIISQRLGQNNPYTNGQRDPLNPAYYKGYNEYSQDVLIPSFIAAYSGHSAAAEPLIDYNHQTIHDDPFKYYIPMPNWKLNFSGLSKLPFIKKYMKTLVITSGYTGTMTMNGFNSSLLFGDLYGLGYPSFLDSNSHNYVPYYQVPNVTITQALNPLVGIEATLLNNVSAKFEVRESKTESLSLIDYQVGENSSKEYVIGMGYRKKGIRLPFKILGVQRLKNELIAKLDLGLRNDVTTNTFLSNNIGIVSRGQEVIRISPTVDYSVSQKLTLHFYFDRQQTIPFVSNSYPSVNTKAGITLRFIFAQ